LNKPNAMTRRHTASVDRHIIGVLIYNEIKLIHGLDGIGGDADPQLFERRMGINDKAL